MAAKWFGSTAQDSVGVLIARRKYSRAIALLREQLTFGARDPRLRNQLADVLVMAGRASEAVPILIGLADDFAREGSGARAIAVLKKIQRHAPGRSDVERRLAKLIQQTDRGAARRRALPTGPGGFGGPVYSGSVNQEIVTNDAERLRAARQASWVPDTSAPAPEAAETEAPAAPPPEPPADDELIEVSMEEFQGQVMDTITQVLRLPVEPESHPEPEPELEIQEEAAPEEVASSPLFRSFSPEELLAVIGGLKLLSYAPGDVIVLEGDPGDSLFVVTSGIVKAFVRAPGPEPPRLARSLGEGEFFGEISILSGRPRTATVTASTHCELLELDRATLDEITRTHPGVRRVLEDFYVERAGD